MELGKKESDFLRLKRVKLGLKDFQMLKVIGRGAFGEVCRRQLREHIYQCRARRYDLFRRETRVRSMQ